jgi:hypothetical protein
MNKYTFIVNETDYKHNIIHPKLEIIRSLIIKHFINRFHNIINKYKSINEINSEDIILRFIWKNISSNDPVLPYTNYNLKQLIDDLHRFDLDPKIILNELKLDKLIKKYNQIFDLHYDKIKNKNISNIIITNKNNCLLYKNYKICYNRHIYKQLDKFYNNKFINKDVLFFCLLYRYNYMEAINQQLSIPYSIKQKLKDKYNVNFELFGSGINRYYDNYCSLFYDLEKYFGSMGNFFNIELIEGLYFANPPFDEDIMANMAIKLLDSLKKTNKPLGFIINIPMWDYKISIEIKNKCNTPVAFNKPYLCYDLLRKSKFFYKEYIYCKNEFKYYNIKKDKYVPAVNTFIIIIKNNLLNINDLSQIINSKNVN